MTDQSTAVAEPVKRSEGQIVSDFIRGQSDCKEGIPHRANQSHDYDRGYSAQYEIEQILSERTR